MRRRPAAGIARLAALAPTIIVAAAAGLAGCGELDPYATAPRVAKPDQPTGQRVGICYNTLKSTALDVRSQAQQECPKGTSATRVDTDWYLLNCPLLLPARATFVCTPPAKK